MKQESTDKRIWTRVSEDGKSAAAGMRLGSGGGMKTGAGGKPQPFGWHGYYGETGGGSSSGPVYRGKVSLPNEVRGKVTPPAKTGRMATPPPTLPATPKSSLGQGPQKGAERWQALRAASAGAS